jgi:hypothetical protein
VEGLTVWKFDRISKVQRRELSQRRALLTVKDTASSDLPHIAILGNSLLLDGVEVSLLADRLKGEATPAPYFVLATDYYDWFFGLKRLFAEGMRPRFIALGLSPNQFASPGIRGDYSAQYLFRRTDLVEVARTTHMDATAATGFFLSSVSKFYGTRDITRGFVLELVLPRVGDLLHTQAAGFRDPAVPGVTLRELATDRLQALNDLCHANGSDFVLVIPPTYQIGSETIANAGKEIGVQVLVPVADNELDQSFYQSDGVHLNEMGAKIFSGRLATELQSDVLKPGTQ